MVQENCKGEALDYMYRTEKPRDAKVSTVHRYDLRYSCIHTHVLAIKIISLNAF